MGIMSNLFIMGPVTRPAFDPLLSMVFEFKSMRVTGCAVHASMGGLGVMIRIHQRKALPGDLLCWGSLFPMAMKAEKCMIDLNRSGIISCRTMACHARFLLLAKGREDLLFFVAG
jgi:hypothetical protein